jgi:hypothetical protein
MRASRPRSTNPSSLVPSPSSLIPSPYNPRMAALRNVFVYVLVALLVAALFNGAYWLIAHFLMRRL